jgi:uncharacterized protein
MGAAMATTKKKSALITGASSGTGLELAKRFAAEGHDLVLVGHSENELNLIAKRLEMDHGIRVVVIVKDLFDPVAAREVYSEVKAQGIEIDYLVNDAGQALYGELVASDLDHKLATIDLNICSLVVLTKLFVKDMIARNEGRILQFAPVENKASEVFSALEPDAKAFIYSLTQSMIADLQGTNVTMTVLRPGAGLVTLAA